MSAIDYRIELVPNEAYDGGYSHIPIDTSDPRNAEPLVPLESVGVAYESHHARDDGGNWPYHRPVSGARKDMWLRATPAAMLARANRRLEPFGAEVFVLDGYRSIECQRGLWAFYREEGAGLGVDPDAYAAGRVTDPGPFAADDPSTWPAHVCGASVDLTLRDIATRTPVDMGVRFEDITDAAANDYFERELLAGRIAGDDRRLWNRRLIHWAMTAEGFVNDSFVFWHYDWGNQLYVKMRRALFGHGPDAAWYGYIAPPATKT
ncbi:MAG TPA: M15 family metallopeptidase [Rhizomicrobium sp.]|nr:M15 family metallopeptidase [Rhizomicrobium sp.]